MSPIGKLSKEKDGYKVVLKRSYPVPLSVLWKAITDQDQLASWFMSVTIELKPGGKMKFQFQDEAKTVMTGKVLRVEHEKVFEYLWENADGPDELATWEVSADGPSTSTLVLTYSRVDEKYGVSVAAGWHTYLDQLSEVLAGRVKAFGHHDGGETPEIRKLKTQYASQL